MAEYEFNAHPLMILRAIKPYLFVLILPLVIYRLFWFRLVALVVVIVLAVFSWRSIKITAKNNRILIKRGVFVKIYAEIDFWRISSVSYSQKVADYLFCSADFIINTKAGRAQGRQFDIKLSLSDVKRLCALIYPDTRTKNVKISSLRIALMAVMTSSATTGLILAAPVINQAGGLLAAAINDLFYDATGQAKSLFRALTLIIAALYAVSFVVVFLKNINFKLKSGDDSVEVQSGLYVRKTILFRKTEINNLSFERKALMRPFKLCLTSARIGEYGGENAVVMPIARYGELKRRLNDKFAFMNADAQMIRPAETRQSLFRLMYAFWVALLVIIGLCAASVIIFPRFAFVFIVFATVALLIDLYYGSLCYYNYKNSGLAVGEHIVACGTQRMVIREIYCDKSKIDVVKLSQTPTDRRLSECKVKIIMRGGTSQSVKVKNLDKEKVMKQLNNAFNLNLTE